MKFYSQKKLTKEELEHARNMEMTDFLVLYTLIAKQLIEYVMTLQEQFKKKGPTSFSLKMRISNKGMDLQHLSRMFRDRRSALLKSKTKEKAGRK